MSSSLNPIGKLQELSVKRGWPMPTYDFFELDKGEFQCVVTLKSWKAEAISSRKQFAKNLAASSLLQNLNARELLSRIAAPCSSTRQLGTYSQMNLSITQDCAPSSICGTQNFDKVVSHLSHTFKMLPVGTKTPENHLSSTLLNSKALSISAKHDSLEISDSDESQSSCFSETINFDSELSFINGGYAYKADFLKNVDSSNAVSFLNTLLAKRGYRATYQVVDTQNFGTNHPIFSYKVTALGKIGQGRGTSKKEAKGNAALSLLEIINKDSVDGEIKTQVTVKDNYVGQLIEFCQSNGIKVTPIYTCRAEGAAHLKIFTMRCQVGEYQAESSAKTKQEAKNMCAKALLNQLERDSSRVGLQSISFVSALDNKDVNENAWKRLTETRVRDNFNLNSNFDLIPFQDYPRIFDKLFYGNSKTLESLQKDNLLPDIKSIPDHEQIFKKILNELSIIYVVQKISDHSFNLICKSHPEWSFIQSGDSEKEARQRLFMQGLEFLYVMSSQMRPN